MRNSEKEKIKSSKLKSGYTEVTWTPDFKKFGMEKYDNNISKLLNEVKSLNTKKKIYTLPNCYDIHSKNICLSYASQRPYCKWGNNSHLFSN